VFYILNRQVIDIPFYSSKVVLRYTACIDIL